MCIRDSDTVDVPASKMKISIAEILLKEGYIKNFEVVDVDNFNLFILQWNMAKTRMKKSFPVLREFPNQVCVFTLVQKNYLRFSADLDVYKRQVYGGTIGSRV